MSFGTPAGIGSWILTAIGMAVLLLAVLGLFLPDVGPWACVAAAAVAAMFLAKGFDRKVSASPEPKKRFRVSASFLAWGTVLSLPMIGCFIGIAVGKIERDNVALVLGVVLAQWFVYFVGGVVHAFLRPKAEEEGESPAFFPDFIEGALILAGGAIALVGWLLSLGK
jgi:hypothetical protein